MPVLAAAAAGAAVASGVGGSAALVAAVGATAATAIGSVAGAIVAAGISVLTAKKPPDLTDEQFRGVPINTVSNVEPIPIIYGATRVGGAHVLRETTGSDFNMILHIVQILGEGPINAVREVYLDETPIGDPRFDPPEAGAGRFAEYTAHLGTGDQAADAELVALVTGWTDVHTLSGIAYVYVRVSWSPEVFPSGLPTITVDVEGRTLYDPRDASTSYSANPALAIRDYLTNDVYGRGVPADEVDDASFIAAANTCDESIDLPTGAAQSRYALGGLLSPDNTIRNNLQTLAATCRGLVIYSAGKWRMVIDGPGSVAAFELDESNITGSWSLSLAGKADRYNRVNAQFTNVSERAQPDIAPVQSDLMLAADGGKVLEAELDLRLVPDRYRAEWLAGIELKASRQGITVGLTATMEALRLEVGDLVNVTHSTPGWVAKPFRVVRVELSEADVVALTLSEYDESVFDLWDIDAAPVRPDTTLPDPFNNPPPTNLALASGTAHLLQATDGTILSRLLATWELAPDALVVSHEIQWRKSTDQDWLNMRVSSSSTSAYLMPVVDGKAYDVRVRTINVLNRPSPWATEVGHYVVGKTAAPPIPTGFGVLVQLDGTREFYWDELDTLDVPDLAGYKIRYAGGSVSTWGALTPLHTGLVTESPWEINRPGGGHYTFAIAAADTSGNIGQAAFIETDLADPRLGSLVVSKYPSALGWPGVKTDCHVTGATLYADNTGTWATAGTWAAMGAWAQFPVGSIQYVDSITFDGAITPLTAQAVVTVVANGSATVEQRTYDGSWSSWGPVGAFTNASVLEIRATVTGSHPVLSSLPILIY